MDITELHDEENLLVQMQDRWENYGSLDGIADTNDPFDLAGCSPLALFLCCHVYSGTQRRAPPAP